MQTVKKQTKSKFTRFRPVVFTRHPSHSKLRTELPLLPTRSVVRLGSTTIKEDGRERVEINTVQSIKNSANKLLMKKCFVASGVKTADWFTEGNLTTWASDKYPIIAKSLYGSRGKGNTLINNQEELNQFLTGKTQSNYIFEKYYKYSREYRLHVTDDGCFYTCRKLLKNDTPEEKQFQRHDDNCVWILETNEKFKKPNNWNLIIDDCVKALKGLGLTIGAFDVKVQAKDDSPEWIIIESCSAPSFGEITLQKYLEEIPKQILKKCKK